MSIPALTNFAAGNLAKSKSRVAGLEAQLARFEALPIHGDVDAAISARREMEAARSDLETARAVEAHWAGQVAKSEAVATEKADAARHAKALRDAQSEARLVREIEAANLEQAERLRRLADGKSERVALNEELRAKHGLDRFLWLYDPEALVRGRPGRTIPAEYRDQVVWRNGAGRQATTFGPHRITGEMVPLEADYHKTTERVLVRPERFEPATAPASYVDTVVLVDAGGAQLWPPR